MTLNIQILFFFIPILIFPSITAYRCNRSCGTTHVTYPFGFSSGCHIRLNCSSSNGQISIGEFPIQTMNADHIKLIIEPICNRSIVTLHHLFTQNYAPTSRNGILLSNCNPSKATTCKVPSIDVRTQFDSLKCDSNSNTTSGGGISCYSEDKKRDFVDYQNVTRQQCKYLLSSISSETLFNNNSAAASSNISAVSLDIKVVEVGWWLKGSCSCSENANCTPVTTPDRGSGFRCRCNQGFDGDGYLAGSGCRKGQLFLV